ncbi:MAG: RDD family protein [Salinisphaeraceae bacterium]|nr:RDD family protein [Salinisphaeraceae bacterium]
MRRLGAALYDGLLLAALLIAGTAVAVAVNGGEAVNTGNGFFQLWLLFILALFYGWFWRHGGQTLGMRAWGMYLVDNEGNTPPHLKQVFLRLPLAFIAWISVIGLLWCLFDSRGRTAQDALSSTQVVVVPKNKSK